MNLCPPHVENVFGVLCSIKVPVIHIFGLPAAGGKIILSVFFCFKMVLVIHIFLEFQKVPVTLIVLVFQKGASYTLIIHISGM